jgi:hypothetical protein
MAEAPRLNRLEAALRAASAVLKTQPWALVGGLAVSARTEPRFTRDVDLAVAVAVVRSFLDAGYAVSATLEQEVVGRLAAVRLGAPGEPSSGVVVDLLFASSGIEPEVVAAAEPLEVLPGLVVPVARTGDLIALKLLSRDARRPQDAADLAALTAGVDAAERARAHESAARIMARGFARGRDLAADLDQLFETAPE